MTQTLPESRQIRVFTPDQVDGLDWQTLDGQPGVKYKILWESEDMISGLLKIAPGAMEPGHAHREADHHLWVISGSVRVAGRDLEPGSYVYVPTRAEHETVATGPEGCTMFYVYRPHGSVPRRWEKTPLFTPV
jgi:mannose-6-phosphate isomerase-like protein (cupin superfamily)